MLVFAVNNLAVNSLAVNGALTLYVVSKSVLDTLCSVKKCLTDSLSVLSEVLPRDERRPEDDDPESRRRGSLLLR